MYDAAFFEASVACIGLCQVKMLLFFVLPGAIVVLGAELLHQRVEDLIIFSGKREREREEQK